MDKIYSIGETARKVRLSPSTLRNWERDGLIPGPTRLNGNKKLRLYSENDLDAIRSLRKKRFAS